MLENIWWEAYACFFGRDLDDFQADEFRPDGLLEALTEKLAFFRPRVSKFFGPTRRIYDHVLSSPIALRTALKAFCDISADGYEAAKEAAMNREAMKWQEPDPEEPPFE